MSITIDGTTWDVPCEVTRIAEVKESNISGMLLSKTYLSDTLGTWLSYQVRIPVRWGEETQYDALYELLTTATGEHTFTLPYAQGTVTFNGRVKSIKDKLYRGKNGSNYWLGETFQFIGNAPNKVPSGNSGSYEYIENAAGHYF